LPAETQESAVSVARKRLSAPKVATRSLASPNFFPAQLTGGFAVRYDHG